MQVAQSPAKSGGNVSTEFRYQKVYSDTTVAPVQKFNGTVNGRPTNVVMIDPGVYEINVVNLGDPLSSTSNFWFHINS